MERILFECSMGTKDFIGLVSIAETIKDEFELGYDKEGMMLRIMDDSHVSLFALDIPKTEFISWLALEEGKCAFSLGNLKNILKPKGNSVITLKAYTTEKLDSYVLDIKSEEIGGNQEITETLNFTIPIEEGRGSLNKIPCILANTSVKLNDKEEILKDLEKIRLVSDYVILMGGKKLALKSDTEESRSTGDLTIIKNVKCNGVGIGSYCVEFLLPILRVINGKIELKWDSGRPLQVTFGIEKFIGMFFLAPKVIRE